MHSGCTIGEDIYEIFGFGLGLAHYFQHICLVKIALIDKTKKNKGLSLIAAALKVHLELLKLNGINLLGRKILINKVVNLLTKLNKYSFRKKSI